MSREFDDERGGEAVASPSRRKPMRDEADSYTPCKLLTTDKKEKAPILFGALAHPFSPEGLWVRKVVQFRFVYQRIYPGNKLLRCGRI
jgi:hypothetical protein